jgi:hypothetical protein
LFNSKKIKIPQKNKPINYTNSYIVTKTLFFMAGEIVEVTGYDGEKGYIEGHPESLRTIRVGGSTYIYSTPLPPIEGDERMELNEVYRILNDDGKRTEVRAQRVTSTSRLKELVTEVEALHFHPE